jgi:ABC-2 type transport system permease protein
MSQAAAFLRRDYLIAASYRTAFLAQVISIFIGVPVLFFIGRVFQGADSDMLKAYNGDFFAFLLIGVAFIDFHAVSLRTFSNSLRESQLMGTLELVLLSPTALTSVLVNSSLFVYITTVIRFLLYMITGLVYGLQLGNANFLGAMLILVLGILSFASFGILSASVIMILKRGAGFSTAVSAASLFFGGVLYPTDVLPAWLHPVSMMLPITHALRGMRLALLGGSSFAELLPTFGILLLFAAILIPLSLTCFWLAVRHTKVTGTLAQY